MQRLLCACLSLFETPDPRVNRLANSETSVLAGKMNVGQFRETRNAPDVTAKPVQMCVCFFSVDRATAVPV